VALPNHNEAVQKAFGPAVAGKLEGRHVQNLTGELGAAASAPVTEIAIFKLRAGGSMDKLRESIAELRVGPSTGCLGIVSGDCVEHPDTYIAMLGWESVEVYFAPLILVPALNFVCRPTLRQQKPTRLEKSFVRC
jgi:hypothetical protein